jgi:hypothetical protein
MVNKHSWFLTINNPLESEIKLCKAALYDSTEHRGRSDLSGTYYGQREKIPYNNKESIPIKGLAYFGFAQETGKQGTKHLHCIVVFQRAKSFNSIKKLFPRANIQALRGTFDEAVTYVRKDGRYHSISFVPTERVKTYIDNDNQLTRLSADGDRSLQDYHNEVKELRQELQEFKEVMLTLLSQKKILNTLE